MVQEITPSRSQLISQKPCSDIEKNLGDLKFTIQTKVLTIKPQGYMHQLNDNGNCLLGLESIPDSHNHYKLGMQFLKNFYTVLDYQNNIIRIGVNAAGPSAKSGAKGIDDHHHDDGEEKSSNTFMVILFLFLALAIGFFIYKRYTEDKEETKIRNASVE